MYFLIGIDCYLKNRFYSKTAFKRKEKILFIAFPCLYPALPMLTM